MSSPFDHSQLIDVPFVSWKSMSLFDTSRIACTAFLSKDKSLLAVGYVDGLVRLVNPQTETVQTLPHRHQDRCVTLTFSDNGDRLLSPSLDSTVRIWDTKTSQQLLKFNVFGAACFGAFSPDGKTIATGTMGPIFTTQFWNAESGECQAAFDKHKNLIYHYIFLDNEQVISLAADKTPYLLNVSTGKPIRVFVGHKNTIYSGNLSSDKTQLIYLIGKKRS
ncbi:MAG: hypothetical protein LBE12_03150 [Planctomycetaceae bacterium]|jgi:WD40 repeat protein|nr:hypothetical protein [Planctomycetaceae bacterium]